MWQNDYYYQSACTASESLSFEGTTRRVLTVYENTQRAAGIEANARIMHTTHEGILQIETFEHSNIQKIELEFI